MQVVRIYTGEDGESHIEDLQLPYEQVGHSMRTGTQAATGLQFSSLTPGQLVEFHTAPRRQYVITLQGQVEIGLGDGTKRIFNVGDIELCEDLTGRGHTTRSVGNSDRGERANPPGRPDSRRRIQRVVTRPDVSLPNAGITATSPLSRVPTLLNQTGVTSLRRGAHPHLSLRGA